MANIIVDQGGIAFGGMIELPDSQRHEWTQNGWEAERSFLCRWEERLYIAPAPGTPFSWDMPALRLTSCAFYPFGEARTGHDHSEYCRVVCKYSTKPPLDTPAITWTPRLMALQIMAGRTWADTGEPIPDEGQVSYFSTADLTIELSQQQSPDYDAIRACYNTLNHSTYNGCNRGTLRFDGVETRIEWDYYGDSVYRLIYKFFWQDGDQNYIWRGSTQTWELVDPGIYGYSNFDTLGIF